MSHSANMRGIPEYDHLKRNVSFTWILSYEFTGIIWSIMSTIKAQWIRTFCYCDRNMLLLKSTHVSKYRDGYDIITFFSVFSDMFGSHTIKIP